MSYVNYNQIPNNNLAPPTHFHPYIHQHINSSTNLNNISKNLYPQKDNISNNHQQDPMLNSNKNNHKTFNQTGQSYFHHL